MGKWIWTAVVAVIVWPFLGSLRGLLDLAVAFVGSMATAWLLLFVLVAGFAAFIGVLWLSARITAFIARPILMVMAPVAEAVRAYLVRTGILALLITTFAASTSHALVNPSTYDDACRAADGPTPLWQIVVLLVVFLGMPLWVYLDKKIDG